MPKQYGKSWQEYFEEAKNNVDSNGCWVSTPTPKGARRHCRHKYGDTTMIPLCKIAYLEYHGDIPVKMCVCHSCHNSNCVNPEHLFLGTQADNMRSSAAANWPNGQEYKGSKGIKNGGAKLTEHQVIDIRRKHNEGRSNRSLADEYGVSSVQIGYIINRKNWKHVA